MKKIIFAAVVLVLSSIIYVFGATYQMTHTWEAIDDAVTAFLAMDTAAELEVMLADSFQPKDDDLDIYAGITPSANVQSILGAADYAAMRGLLDLEQFAGSGTSGLVPDPESETGKFLKDDGSWDTPAQSTAADLSVDDLIALSGVAEGDVDMGAFTGSTITDDSTIKEALQEIETELELKAPAIQYGYSPPIPIGWFNGGSSPPDAIDYDTRPPHSYRTFASDADEDLNCSWFVPSDMSTTTTTIQFRVKYLITEATGPTAAEGVAFGLSGVSAGDNDITNFTKGTVVVVQDDALNATQWDLLITPWSGDVTVSGIAAGEVAELALIRDVSDTVDDYAQVVGVIAIEIRYVLEVSAL